MVVSMKLETSTNSRRREFGVVRYFSSTIIIALAAICWSRLMVQARRPLSAFQSSPLWLSSRRSKAFSSSSLRYYAAALQGQSLLPQLLTREGTSLTGTRAPTALFSSKTIAASRPYHLVIVESPSKIHTIETILQEYVRENNLPHDFLVTSCKGHIRNLSKQREDKRKKASTKTLDTTKEGKVSFPYAIPGIDLQNGYKALYEIIPEKKPIVKELRNLASKADKVLLATDPDREGEAMAWHLIQVLSETKTKNPIHRDDFFRRVSFTEITPSAVREAIHTAEGQMLNPALVQAQETRRVLDRLCGFTVSPLLWRKVAPGLSAGRVQSVALALAVQRERERLMFESTPYATVEAELFHGESTSNYSVSASMYSVNGTVVTSSGDDFTSQGRQSKDKPAHKRHFQLDDAADLANFLRHDDTTWIVKQVKSTRKQRSPPAPYRTSTLQQEASRKLGFSVSDCMRAAQQLYEQGWISYMRTDSSTLSQHAEAAVQSAVSAEYGRANYRLPEATEKRKAKSETKFAQEAHEAIRPSIQPNGAFAKPFDPRVQSLPSSCQRLYQMVYQRTLASRMPPLVTNQTQVLIEATRDGTVAEFRASGSVVLHPGYTLAYRAGGDDDTDEEDSKNLLLPLKEGQDLTLAKIEAIDHETKPPARYTEASFVKELEALGVGRPSTYAKIVQILRDRAYVGNPIKADEAPRSKQKVGGGAISAHRAAGGDSFTGGRGGPLVPSLPAFVVCSLLEKHCPSYVDPSFTASMEERLDKIASNDMSSEEERLAYLDEYYAGENGLAATIKRIDDTVDASTARRAILPSLIAEGASSGENEVGLYVGPWGPYVQKVKDNNGNDDAQEKKSPSAALPPDMCTDLKSITPKALQAVLSTKLGGGLLLGTHPEDGRPIRMKTGRYGAYLQWGDDGEENTSHGLPRDKAKIRTFQDDSDDHSDFHDGDEKSSSGACGQLTFEEIVGYVALPRVVAHTDDATPILAGLGPYGPYLKVNSTYVSLKKTDGDVLTVDAETAIRLVNEHAARPKRAARGQLAHLGEKNGAKVLVRQGKFGPYVNWNKVNAKLPSDLAPDKVTLGQAWTLLEPRITESDKSSGSKAGSKKKDLALPPPPKRPLSAYLYFCADKRPQVSNGGKSLGEVSKELSRLWAETDDAARREYDEKANLDKSEYEKKKREWEDACQEITQKKELSKPKLSVIKQAKKKLTIRRSSGIEQASSDVKRPRSAYIFFCNEKRPEVSPKFSTLGKVSKELGRLWSETENRAPYEALAEADKERYNKEKAEASRVVVEQV